MRLYTIFDDMYFHFDHHKAVQTRAIYARAEAAQKKEVSTSAFWTAEADFYQRGLAQ